MDSNTEYIYQVKIREKIEKFPGNNVMIPVYGHILKDNMDIFIHSRLIPNIYVEEELKTDNCNKWNVYQPGFNVHVYNDNEKAVYTRYNNENGIEPFVIERDFNGLKPNCIEIVEEFRLLNNLYYDQFKKTYVDLKNNVDVVKITDKNIVLVYKKYLKRYLAVKNMTMVIHFDSRCVFKSFNASIKDDNLEFRTEDLYYNLNIGTYHGISGKENYSMIYAKKLIRGCNILDCGYYPYNEQKKYEEYIIGIDENGNEKKYTSDPQKLGNYFGANIGAPHYLTPIFFSKDVLTKYYAHPEIYTVEDGIISCGTLWSLYLDNLNQDYVSVYLGDLGRYLPNSKEQIYWKSFNIAIDGKLSEAKYKRDFLAQFANSGSIDFIFKEKYIKVNNVFEEKFGWPLFLQLEQDDLYNFEGLRVPINDSILEMDFLVLSLVKVMLDSLNEKKIVSQLNGKYEKLVGSISKLETWMAEKNWLIMKNILSF